MSAEVSRGQTPTGAPALRTPLRWVVVGAVLLVVLAAAVGWALARSSAKTSSFDAVVVTVNGPGTKGCVQADRADSPVCSDFYTLRDAPTPQLQERVHAQLIQVPTQTGSKDGLVISPASS
ncbi:MAG: hypothetical protein ACTHQ3_23195 [Motilibacteraceae bacterium]